MKYRNANERILHNVLCSLLMTLNFICLGCQDQELVQRAESTDAITFALYHHGEDSLLFSPLARTLEKPLVLINEDGTDSLTFYLTITDSIGLEQPVEQVDTVIARGVPITSDNLVSISSGNIALDAFYETSPFMKDEIYFNSNGEAYTGITRYWPANQGAKVAFWSYHPKEIDEAVNANFTISHDATTPSLSFYYDQKAADNKLKDVTEQKDLFFAYAYQGKEDGVVNLRYEHALSAIKFAVGKTLATTIKNITLTDVVADGTLIYSPKSSPKLSWNIGENPFSTINQDFGVQIDEDLKGNPSQAITKDADNTIFFLIPQSVNGKQLSVTIQKEGKTESDTYTATMPEGEWEMGKTYAYTLSLLDGIDIEMSGDVVDGVEISNTNNKPCYVRAMIMGNWVDSEGNVAAIFNPQDEQEQVDLIIDANNHNYELASNWEEYWYYDENTHLYYYKGLLEGKKSTDVKLFNKFINPKSRISEGLYLDFVVFVQAVEVDFVEEAWGENIANILH